MTSTEFRALNKWGLPQNWMAEHLGNRRVARRTWQHWMNGREGEDAHVPDDVVAHLRQVNSALDDVLHKQATQQ